MRASLAHTSEDKEGFVEPLARELAEMGVAPWLDIWEIRPGDSLVRKLFEEGLDTVGAVIVVVSESSAAKPWVREELGAAVVRRITSNVRLFPSGSTTPQSRCDIRSKCPATTRPRGSDSRCGGQPASSPDSPTGTAGYDSEALNWGNGELQTIARARASSSRRGPRSASETGCLGP